MGLVKGNNSLNEICDKLNIDLPHIKSIKFDFTWNDAARMTIETFIDDKQAEVIKDHVLKVNKDRMKDYIKQIDKEKDRKSL